MDKYIRSSKRNPCPICDRTKDSDCAFILNEVALCHTYIYDDGGAREYVYTKAHQNDLWGIYIHQSKFEERRDYADITEPKLRATKPTRPTTKPNPNPKPTREAGRTQFLYKDKDGSLIVKVERTDDGDRGRKWSQFHLKGNFWEPGCPKEIRHQIHLYRIFEDINQEAIADKLPILLVEGEGKADRLIEIGIPATSCIGGSGAWKLYGYSNYLEDLKGADLILVPDRDTKGVQHMNAVSADFPQASWLYPFPDSPEWDDLPEKDGWDIRDWLDSGATEDDIANAIGEKRSPKSPAPGVAVSLQETASKPPAKDKKPDTLQLLKTISKEATYWHTPDEIAYADIWIEEARKTLAVKDIGFKRWLRRLLDYRHGLSCGSDTLQTVLDTIDANAIYDGERRELNLRVAEYQDKLYLDLANESWQAVEIDRDGWRIVSDCPVRFKRPRSLQPLPTPIRGGSLEPLRELLKFEDDDWQLVLSWLLFTFYPKYSHPILILHGEMGTTKSYTTRILKGLIDPGAGALLQNISDVHRVSVAASNRWVMCYDNLSNIDRREADLLCCLATGMGFSTRTLHTTEEETIFEATRPQIISSIDCISTHSDLANRALSVQLPLISEDERLSEGEIDRILENIKPQVLGALLDVLSKTLQNRETLEISGLGRMADFCEFSIAAETAFGFEEGSFKRLYDESRDKQVQTVVENSPIASAMLGFMQDKESWQGTATELFEHLKYFAPEEVVKSKDWVKSPAILKKILNRVGADLRAMGLKIENEKKDGVKLITAEFTARSPTLPTLPTQDLQNAYSVSDSSGSVTKIATDPVPTLYRPELYSNIIRVGKQESRVGSENFTDPDGNLTQQDFQDARVGKVGKVGNLDLLSLTETSTESLDIDRNTLDSDGKNLDSDGNVFVTVTDKSFTQQESQAVSDGSDGKDGRNDIQSWDKTSKHKNRSDKQLPLSKFKIGETVWNPTDARHELIKAVQVLNGECLYSLENRDYIAKERNLIDSDSGWKQNQAIAKAKYKSTAKYPIYCVGQIVMDLDSGEMMTVIKTQRFDSRWTYTTDGGKKMYAERELTRGARSLQEISELVNK